MATASMDSISSISNGFGLLTNQHLVPALTPSVPTLPLQGSIHAE
jgi:hypothetical protein